MAGGAAAIVASRNRGVHPVLTRNNHWMSPIRDPKLAGPKRPNTSAEETARFADRSTNAGRMGQYGASPGSAFGQNRTHVTFEPIPYTGLLLSCKTWGRPNAEPELN